MGIRNKCWRDTGHTFGEDHRCIWCNQESTMREDFAEIVSRHHGGYVDPAWLTIVVDCLIERVEREP